MLASMQLIFRYGFLELQNIPLALAHWQYGLLVLTTVLIAAGGYVINDIFDQDTDALNNTLNDERFTLVNHNFSFIKNSLESS